MPPKKETPEERSTRYQQQSAALAIKADMQRCIAAMKQNPSAVTEVKRTLTNLGYLFEGEVVRWERPEGHSAGTSAAPSDTPPSVDAAAAGRPSPKAKAKATLDPSTPAPKSPTAASVEQLQAILSEAEPIGLSVHALRGLLRGAQRKIPKGILLEIHTFMSDLDDDADWEQLGTLGNVVK